MIDEKKIKELEKRISTPNYSDNLPSKSSTKTDITKLKKLAKEIRKSVEDYTGESAIHPHSGNRS